ncbi:GDP-mannose 4,6-dehydratase [candidate division WOR-3 bacterium]|nr:GDP-mannose 4,6-dehydratase [candidate division WOR-3 bacterium]
MELKDKNILVTGGAGFIPSHLVDLAVEKGGNVTALDNLKDGKIENLEVSKDKIHFKKIDVRDFDKVKRIIKEKEIEIVFHFAANANVPYSVEDPKYDFETNALGTCNVLKSCLDNDVEKIIYASSAAVYGEPEYTPIDEKHSLNPISPYGASKLAGEKLGFAYYYTYGIPFVSMRIFNTYGPRQPRYVMFDFLKKLRNNPHKLEVLGTGEQIRDYCYVSDTTKAFILAAENENAVGKSFNIAGGNPISIKELAELMIRILRLEGNTEIYYTGKSWEGDIVRLVANVNKIKSELRFRPKVELKDGILRLKEWFESSDTNKKIKNSTENIRLNGGKVI